MAGLRVEATLTLIAERLNALINTPDGLVGRYTNILANQVFRSAVPLIGPRGYSGTMGRPQGRTARLADSGTVEHLNGSTWQVIFRHPAAMVHHEGSPSHSFNESRMYSNPNVGSTRNLKRYPSGKFRRKGPFEHPGHEGNPYLVRAAEQVGLRVSGSLRGGGLVARPKGFF